MKRKDIKQLLALELESILPNFDNVLDKILAVPVPATQVLVTARKVDRKHENVWNKRTDVAHGQPKMKIAVTVLSFCMCAMCVALTMFYSGLFSKVEPEIKYADTYVTLNINPEVDFTVNKFNKITTVKAPNDSGKLLLSQAYKNLDVSTLVGMELNGALMSVIDEATKMGYIDVSGNSITNAIMIDVINSNTKTANASKELLASEAKAYFVSKGIFAVVVTGYDTKQALLDEARKTNPNLTKDSSVGELIQVVESETGGKNIYEQEIERLKKSNDDYQKYLDKALVDDIKLYSNKQIDILNGEIAKEVKILESLTAIRSEYDVALALLSEDKARVLASIGEYQKELDSLEGNIEGTDDVLALKEELRLLNIELNAVNVEIASQEELLLSLESEYDMKKNKIEQNKAELKTQLDIDSARKVETNNNINVLNADIEELKRQISVLNGNVSDNNNAIAELNRKINEIKILNTAYGSELNKFNTNRKYAEQFINYHGMYTKIVAVMEDCKSIIEPSGDNYIVCDPNYAIYNVLKYITDNNKLLYLLYNSVGADLKTRVDSVLDSVLGIILNDTTLYTAEEIEWNEQNKNKVVEVGNYLKKVVWEDSGMKNDPFYNLVVNLKVACAGNGIAFDASGETMVIDEAKIKDNIKTFDAKINDAKLDIAANNALIVKYEAEIKGCESDNASKLSESKTLDSDVDAKSTELIAMNNELADIITSITESERKIGERDIELKNAKTEYGKVASEMNVILTDKKGIKDEILANIKKINSSIDDIKLKNLDRIEELKRLIAAAKVELSDVNVKINEQNNLIIVKDGEISVVKNIINGYNSDNDAIKSYKANYVEGARITLTDKNKELEFNDAIVAIEQRIAGQRVSSERDMEENIKNNIEKQSQYLYEANIDKYNNHQVTMTPEEYDEWESAQQKLVEERGWEDIYREWLDGQERNKRS